MPWSKNPLAYPDYCRQIMQACGSGAKLLIKRDTHAQALLLRNEYGAFVRALEHAALRAEGPIKDNYLSLVAAARTVTCYLCNPDHTRNPRGTHILFLARDSTPRALDVSRQIAEQTEITSIPPLPDLNTNIQPTNPPKDYLEDFISNLDPSAKPEW